jgi:NADPH:quinone reductase-like Zn-dependent oxidoreductase
VGVRPVGADLAGVRDLIQAGKVRVHVSQTFPLSEGPAAIERVRQGHSQGKLVLIR